MSQAIRVLQSTPDHVNNNVIIFRRKHSEGFTQISNRWFEEEGLNLTRNEKQVIMVIYSYSNYSRPIFMSISWLSEKVQCSEASIKRWVKSLVNKGAIEKVKVYWKQARKWINTYRIIDPDILEAIAYKGNDAARSSQVATLELSINKRELAPPVPDNQILKKTTTDRDCDVSIPYMQKKSVVVDDFRSFCPMSEVPVNIRETRDFFETELEVAKKDAADEVKIMARQMTEEQRIIKSKLKIKDYQQADALENFRATDFPVSETAKKCENDRDFLQKWAIARFKNKRNFLTNTNAFDELLKAGVKAADIVTLTDHLIQHGAKDFNPINRERVQVIHPVCFLLKAWDWARVDYLVSKGMQPEIRLNHVLQGIRDWQRDDYLDGLNEYEKKLVGDKENCKELLGQLNQYDLIKRIQRYAKSNGYKFSPEPGECVKQVPEEDQQPDRTVKDLEIQNPILKERIDKLIKQFQDYGKKDHRKTTTENYPVKGKNPNAGKGARDASIKIKVHCD